MMEQPIVILEEITSFPYNSELDPLGIDDRLYDSQDWADYFRQFISNGVYPNPSTGLKVESLHGSMVLTVHPGSAFAEGRFYFQRKAFEFSVNPAHLTLNRFDAVVCRADNINRIMQVLYIPGEATPTPQSPPAIRNDDIFDLVLAVISVPANAQSISQSNILDTRLNPEVCGIVHGIIDQVDTTGLFNQYDQFLKERMEYWEATKLLQAADWQNQMTQQSGDWQAQRTDYDVWIAAARADITTLQSFFYHNWLELKGCTYYDYPRNEDGQFISEIKVGDKLVARQTEWKENGDWYARIDVYEEDGETIRKTATRRDYKDETGVWKGEVV